MNRRQFVKMLSAGVMVAASMRLAYVPKIEEPERFTVQMLRQAKDALKKADVGFDQWIPVPAENLPTIEKAFGI